MDAIRSPRLARTDRMKQPRQTPCQELTLPQRRALAREACYVGSPEHKDGNWWGGLPRARQLRGGGVGRPGKQRTTVCPLTAPEDQQRATRWVRTAIAEGQYKFVQADQKYPKRIWYRAAGTVWEGWCINTQAGEYKGWPIREEERDAIFG